MKIRFPTGIPLDDLDVGSRYEFEMRNQKLVAGRFLQLMLRRGWPPQLAVMPDGAAMQVVLRLPSIKEIRLAGVDGDTNEAGETGEECC